MTLHFTVLGRPQPAGSKRAFRHSKTNAIVVTDDAKGSRAWKQQVAGEAESALRTAQANTWFSGALLTGALYVDITFIVKRPQSHLGTGRNAHTVKRSAPAEPITRPDVDKLSRAVLDALSGVVYRDDAQIVTKTVRKQYGAPERCEITVNTLDHRNGNQP